MKSKILTLLTVSILGASAFAGETYVAASSKNEVRQETAISLYGPEWTFDIFGTYAFTSSSHERILGDHAFGGGIAFNRFFTTNLGFGIEGQAIRTQNNGKDVVGSTALNFFYRMPLGESGWAPYLYTGAGVLFNTENDFDDITDDLSDEDLDGSDDALFEGHFGAGVEYRITRNFGLFTDGRWTVVEGPRNNFPSVRAGVRFAF